MADILPRPEPERYLLAFKQLGQIEGRLTNPAPRDPPLALPESQRRAHQVRPCKLLLLRPPSSFAHPAALHRTSVLRLCSESPAGAILVGQQLATRYRIDCLPSTHNPRAPYKICTWVGL